MTTFNSDVQPATNSTAQVWTGRVLSGIVGLFLAFGATMQILQPQAAVEGTTKLGYPASMLLPLGIIELIALALYLIPRTSVLGAIVWTGYLGGAVATHVRVGDPLFTHILMPVYFAAVLWGALALRNAQVRAVLKGAR
ncbi:MAG TPA: DoxX family protein [Thermoanaerobaculia bacterium]|nr:DoxX family protein [Thermoanaerobaculia bacterium]